MNYDNLVDRGTASQKEVRKLLDLGESCFAIVEDMLAALMLPANQPHIPQQLKEFTDHWYNRFQQAKERAR